MHNLISLCSLILFLTALCCSGETVQRKVCRHDSNVTYTCNYIPNSIPKGTLKFCLSIDTLDTFVLKPTTFQGKNWRRLQHLELKDPKNIQKSHVVFNNGCFKGLAALMELHLHVWYPEVFIYSFLGLKYVNTLDLSGCGNITIKQLSLALNRSDSLPGLQKIVLSNWNLYEGSYAFDDNFVEMLLPRNITYIDVSNSQLSYVNVTAVFQKLTSLKFLNSSHAIISDLTVNTASKLHMKHLKMLDLSHALLPKKTIPMLPGKLIIYNQTFKLSDLRIQGILAPEAVNISGIVPQLTSFWLENITFDVNEDPLLYTKTLIMRQNNLKKLDIRVSCESFHFSSVEIMDISDNGMEFVHPTFLNCFRNVKNVYLSKNLLFKMAEENISLFQGLFSHLKYLEFIDLSANKLQKIPSNLFQGNKYIETVDLSYNLLEQVTFTLAGLENLKYIDLQHNNIHILDSLSIQCLNSIPSQKHLTASKPKIKLMFNPISCSVCAAKPFLTWLITTELIDTATQSLKCSSETGKLKDINYNSIKLVERICVRKTIIISTSVSAAVTVLFHVTCILLIYKRYKRKQKYQFRANTINNLREGDGQYQFLTFLSFSSEDSDFVKTFILEQLNENLQLMTGIDRNLVCTGDEHFRPGFYIHNEAFRLLDTAAVVVVVVSNNFCASDFCRNELDQAYVKGKPIILMFIEHVEPNLMMPTMKELYQRNVRILWTVENGEHVLKTSWENVCTSILDHVKCNEQL